ncbi:hypothetical protein ACIQWL_53945 [Streptomyces mirabilis]|uniref:hypothetical protein n=2 Tax=Streptomyces mirabilis TaxID=68239 RepID=UPI003825077F
MIIQCGPSLARLQARDERPGSGELIDPLVPVENAALFDDLAVGRTISLRSALQGAEVVKAGHLDEPAPLATVNATLWDVAQRCARLSSLRRARERAGRHAAHGVMSRSCGFPGSRCAEAVTGMGGREEVARQVMGEEVDRSEGFGEQLLVRRGRRHRITGQLLEGLVLDRRLSHLASQQIRVD